MAESADALDSGSSGSNTVCVQVTLSAPYVFKPKTALYKFCKKGCFLVYFFSGSSVFSHNSDDLRRLSFAQKMNEHK